MPSTSSFSRRCALMIVITSPVLLGFFKCVAVSNPSVTTARIDMIEPRAPRVGDVMNVVGSGNGTPPLQFAWDFGDGFATGGMQAAHVYGEPGSYTVVFTVRDALGNISSDASQVSVSPRFQPSKISMMPLKDAIAGEPVMFMATTSDTDVDAVSYAWVFSDGQSAVGSQAVAIFPIAAKYSASISVTKDRGESSFEVIEFDVVDAAR